MHLSGPEVTARCQTVANASSNDGCQLEDTSTASAAPLIAIGVILLIGRSAFVARYHRP